MVIDAVLDGYRVLVQVGYKLHTVKDFLDVILFTGQLQISHTVHAQFVPPVMNDFHAFFDEELRVVQQILQTVALY